MDNKDDNKEIKKIPRKKKKIIESEEIIKEEQIKSKDKIKKNSNLFLIIFITAVITMFIVLLVWYLIYGIKPGTTGNIEFVKNVNITENGIADSVEKVIDSVVVVENYKNGKLASTGTGFVFKKDDKYGYILTNSHVVETGTEHYAIFTNNEKVKVELVGNDTYSDVAVLSVNSKNIVSVAELGSSEDLRVGDTAFTVGAPLDATAYSWTVTRGIISGKNRKVEVSVSANNSFVMNVLQTDAPINSGNSGGPLCNVNGEVIGITNMKISNTTVEGMGFAIPIEVAVEYANKFINKEAIVRPYLGISMYDASNTILKVDGVYVVSVEENSSAAKAGIKEGDIITKINDVTIKNTSYFKYELYKYNIGDKITLTLTRDNKEHKMIIKLEGLNKNI